MFTGIIQTVGKIASLERRSGDVRLQVSADLPWQEIALGDSIATNGVCLTAVDFPANSFVADVSVETLSLTTVGRWKVGTDVNLELALTPQSRLGGHIVSGHVDGVGEVVKREADARSERFIIRAPKSLAKYIAHKGSITVDGTSLTVNQVDGDCFDLNIVPHTIAHTIIGQYHPGTLVNLEVDVIARYLERLLMGDAAAESHASGGISSGGISASLLAENGFGVPDDLS